MALPYSDAPFVMAFERECTETFWEGHVQAFEFFGGVPRRISYDNTKVAVAQIIGGGKARRLTRGFCQLKSHYLFEHHFCRPARGNEKGVVEGVVKFTRLNFFVPVPQVRDFTRTQCGLAATVCGGSAPPVAGAERNQGRVAPRRSGGVSAVAGRAVCGLPPGVDHHQLAVAGAV